MAVALLVIDMQMGMAVRTAAGRPRANANAETNVATLLALFRSKGLPVVHVHHDDPDPASPFRRGEAEGAVMPCAAEVEGEKVFWKTGSSGFAGTGLDAWLRKQGIDRLVIAGAVAAFCVTSTTRAAKDLGFDVTLVSDALIGFDIPAHDGGRIDADTVLRVTLSLLGADFGQLATTDQVASLL